MLDQNGFPMSVAGSGEKSLRSLFGAIGVEREMAQEFMDRMIPKDSSGG